MRKALALVGETEERLVEVTEKLAHLWELEKGAA
jgi:hypothetical protein